MGPPKFFDASVPACHSLRTPADIHTLTMTDVSYWLRRTLKPSPSATNLFRSCTNFQGTRLPLRPTGFSVYASPPLFTSKNTSGSAVGGRVAAGIPSSWYVPPPSQNRTWSVTPSGSQFESSTAGWDRGDPRPLCEANKISCHEQSPLGVGSCFTHPLSQTGAPLLPPRYRSSSLVLAPPTSPHRRSRPRCLDLFGTAR